MSIIMEEYKGWERKLIRINQVCFAIVSAVLVFPVPIFGTNWFLADRDRKSRYEVSSFHLRSTQAVIYGIIGTITLVIGSLFIYRMRKYMYLYYKDVKVKVLINIFGLITYLIMMLNHVLRELLFTNSVYLVLDQPTDFERYLFGYAMELVACAIMAFSRITDDLFINLNRERTLLKISLFQYDYLSAVDPRLLGHIKVSGDASQLRDEIEQTQFILVSTEDQIRPSTCSYIEKNFVQSVNTDYLLESSQTAKLS